MVKKVAVISEEYSKFLKDGKTLHTDVAVKCDEILLKINQLVSITGPIHSPVISSNVSILTSQMRMNMLMPMKTMFKTLEKTATDYSTMVGNIDNG